jgi:acyl-CoA synthetase (AMP-forming)/AMP-acid ligase II
VGEICLRTAALFSGYWNDPDATATALDGGGWYRTGDFGHLHDGLLYLQGRRRDLIIRGGENIYPAEIESRLMEHPGVGEVAVIGTDHPTLGQEVKAVVVRRSGPAVGAGELQAWVAAALSPFKVPAVVEFVDRLPHNASGKVLKHLVERPVADSGFIEE